MWSAGAFRGAFAERNALTKEVTHPKQPAEIANLAARDLIKPASDVLAVEVGQASVDDQEYVLNQVIAIGFRSTHRSNPAQYLLEPLFVNRVELEGWCRRRGLPPARTFGPAELDIELFRGE